MPELNVSCQRDSANEDIYAALHAFARSLNSEHLSFMADPPGAMIISRLAAAREVARELHVRELTKGSHFSPTAILRRLDQLERNGLIRRVSDPSDGRSKLVSLTDKGRASAERAALEIGLISSTHA